MNAIKPAPNATKRQSFGEILTSNLSVTGRVFEAWQVGGGFVFSVRPTMPAAMPGTLYEFTVLGNCLEWLVSGARVLVNMADNTIEFLDGANAVKTS